MLEDNILATRLSSLLQSAEALNKASNSLNTTLDAVEQMLVKANVGNETWLSQYPLTSSKEKFGGSDELTVCRSQYLGFVKLQDKWQLAVKEEKVILEIDKGGMEIPFETQDYKVPEPYPQPYPLAQASRQDRLQALQLLPDLLKKIDQEAQKVLADIEDATQLVLQKLGAA